MLPELTAVLQSVYGESVKIQSTSSVGGGSINQCQALTLNYGKKLFVKSHAAPPQGFFAKEAEGLNLLCQAENGPRVPEVVALGPGDNAQFLILEYLQEAGPNAEFYVRFAQALAGMHAVTQDRFGLDHENFIGKTPQQNEWESDGLVFFRERRIRFQQELARKSGRLPKAMDQNLDRLCERLPDLLDLTGERPALCHGDLWSGNYFCDADGRPCIFDPAAHYGLRETDLAMMQLFGGPPEKFFDVYNEAFPLNPGYSERREIFNLYHLLNHLNLFGGSYLSSVQRTVEQFI